MLNKKITAIIASVLIAGNTFLTADLSSEWFIAPVTVSAAASDDAQYTFIEYEDHAELDYCVDNYASDITVPREYNGLPVTVIGSFAFEGCKGLRSVTLPDTVTTFRDSAFACCDDLEEVTIPDSVTDIGYFTFWESNKIPKVVIPDSVTKVSAFSFWECNSLTEKVIPESTTITYDLPDGFSDYRKSEPTEVIEENSLVVEDGVLVDASNYSGDLVIHDYVTSIDSEAFNKNQHLKSVIIPDSVTQIGHGAFSGCTYLKSVVIPDSVTSISYETFQDCISLESVTLPDSLTDIGVHAFWNCRSLKSITLPDSLTSICREAFGYCNNLESVIIPDSVTGIGYKAFDVTPWLKKQIAEDPLVIVNGMVISGYDCSGDVVIPDSATKICSGAFMGCENIKSVTVPSSVIIIGNYVFGDCDNLSSLTILNPECKIRGEIFSTENVATISGFAGSIAQKHAEKYGLKFETLPDDYVPEPAKGPALSRDVNEDDVVNMADVICLTKNLLAFSGSSDFTAYDVNGDGQFNIMDLLAVKRTFL